MTEKLYIDDMSPLALAQSLGRIIHVPSETTVKTHCIGVHTT
jgi:hypothetical protein